MPIGYSCIVKSRKLISSSKNTAFLILRFITVIFLRPKRLALAWDDYLLIPAYILTTGMASIGLGETFVPDTSTVVLTAKVIHKYASNPVFHADEPMIDPAAVPVLKAGFAMTQLVTPAFALTRFSILALFLRIFYRSYVRWTSYFLIGFIALQVVAFNVAAAVECLPSTYYWNRVYYGMYGGDGHCVNLDKFYISFQGPEMFVDLMMILIPLPEVWRLRSTRSRRLALTILFLTGVIALIANCFRQVTFVHNHLSVFTPRIMNHTQAWLVAEPSICFIAACLPAMHPLVKTLTPTCIKRSYNRAVRNTPQAPLPEAKRSDSECFQRLVDERAASAASIARPGMARGRYEAKADRSSVTHETAARTLPSVPLTDWQFIKQGQGVLMRQDVEVSQEQVIEDVLGL
ncbi:MAG: hypothetical protein Q9159_006933 [Coniocarpon cinnabarinum]